MNCVSQLPGADQRDVLQPSTCMVEDAITGTAFLSCPMQEQEVGSSVGLKPGPVYNGTGIIYARRELVLACVSISNLLL